MRSIVRSLSHFWNFSFCDAITAFIAVQIDLVDSLPLLLHVIRYSRYDNISIYFAPKITFISPYAVATAAAVTIAIAAWSSIVRPKNICIIHCSNNVSDEKSRNIAETGLNVPVLSANNLPGKRIF